MNPERFLGISTYKIRKELNYFLVENLKNIEHCLHLDPLLYASEHTEGFESVTPKIMEKITGNKFVKHIAICPKIKPEFNFNQPFFIFDNILDFGNIGSIIRNAFSFGFTNLIFIIENGDFYSHKTFEASRGLIFHVKPALMTKEEVIAFIKENELSVFISDSSGGSIEDFYPQSRTAIVFGNESNGVSNELKALKHINIGIPIEFESLNVSVANGIFMYHFSKHL